MPKINEKQNIEITEIRKDICYLKKEIAEIKEQISNHLPGKIEELTKDLQNFKISNSRWLIGILVSLLFLLLGVIANLIK